MFERIRTIVLGNKRPELDQDRLGLVARELLLYAFGPWGGTLQEKVDAIKAAAELARVEVIFTIEDDRVSLHYPVASPWPEFRLDLLKCYPREMFGQEIAAVKEVIRNYYNRFD
ncbi:hypothetical protein ES708_12285 [subsurface metagenome]